MYEGRGFLLVRCNNTMSNDKLMLVEGMILNADASCTLVDSR